MRKRMIWALLALAVALFLASCGAETGGASAVRMEQAAGPAEPEFDRLYAWCLSTVSGAESPVAEMYRRFAELTEKATGGAVTVTVLTGGVVGSEEAALEQVSQGRLELCDSLSAAILAYSPEQSWILCPELVPEEAFAGVYNSGYWRAIRERWAAEHNVRDLCGVTLGGAAEIRLAGEAETVLSWRGFFMAEDLFASLPAHYQEAVLSAARQAMGEYRPAKVPAPAGEGETDWPARFARDWPGVDYGEVRALIDGAS